jgi:hypothetical protein
MLPPSQGFGYVLICVDHFSKLLETATIVDIKTKTVEKKIKKKVSEPPGPHAMKYPNNNRSINQVKRLMNHRATPVSIGML